MNKDRLTKLLDMPVVRYFIMAGFVVGVEMAVFIVMNRALAINYLVATVASMVVAILLNWYLSRKVVFTGSQHKLHVEFVLIITTSAVGIVIQLAVTALCVETLHRLPEISKFLAIVTTFFWNFWVRKRFIFKFDTF